MKTSRKILILSVFVLLAFAIVYYVRKENSSSQSEIEAGVPERKVDVPDVAIDLKINRFDKDLLKINQGDYQANFKKLLQSYPFFVPFYAEFLAQIERSNSPNFGNGIKDFLSNEYISMLYQDVENAFPNDNWLRDTYTNGFKFYKSVFPKAVIPKIYTVVTGFKYANSLCDSGVCVGLDLYLGANYKFYPKVDFIYKYQRRRLTKEYMLPNTIQLLIEDQLGSEPNGNVLEGMIYKGKVLYAMKQCLPNHPDSLISGYSAAQERWCKENEGNVWAFLVSNKLIFSNDVTHLNKILNDGPFTQGMPEESPGRIGWWVGWKLVDSYMKSNPDVTINQLFLERDCKKILTLSGYKPQPESDLSE